MGFWNKNRRFDKWIGDDSIKIIGKDIKFTPLPLPIKTKIELLNKIAVENPQSSDLHKHAKKKLIELIDKL